MPNSSTTPGGSGSLDPYCEMAGEGELHETCVRFRLPKTSTRRGTSPMDDQQQAPEISYEVRVKPGRAGTDPEAPDWEVVELEDGEIKNSADIYDNMTQSEANQIAGMWRRKKEEAKSEPAADARG